MWRPGDAARQAGAVILAESTRLEHLIGDLLDLARLGAKDFSVTPVPVNLTAAMEAAATVWRARCGEVGVEFAADLPAVPAGVVHGRGAGQADRRRADRERAASDAGRSRHPAHPAGRRPTGRRRGTPVATHWRSGDRGRGRRPGAHRRRPRSRIPAIRSVRAIPRRATGGNRAGAGIGAGAGHSARAAPRASPRPPTAELSSRSGFRLRHRSRPRVGHPITTLPHRPDRPRMAVTCKRV